LVENGDMHSHELLLVVRADIWTCGLGALPCVIAPVYCYATVIALSRFCFGSTHVPCVLRWGDPRFNRMVAFHVVVIHCCCWPSLWKCCTPWCANISWCPCLWKEDTTTEDWEFTSWFQRPWSEWDGLPSVSGTSITPTLTILMNWRVSLEICVQKWVGTVHLQHSAGIKGVQWCRPTFSSAYHVVRRSVVVIIWWACSYSLQDQHVGQTRSFTSNVFWSCCHGSVPHSNNARYLPVYTLHMLQLPTKHPEPH